MSKFPITSKGFASMKAELDNLRGVARIKVTKEIEEARAWGDLSENAEYKAAKDKQGFLEAQIRELDSQAKHAEVIDPTKLSGDKAKFGATVTLLNEKSQEVTYSIVGEYEADISLGLLSYSSPLGRSLIGKQAGDFVEVALPRGNKVYKVVKIEYIEIESIK